MSKNEISLDSLEELPVVRLVRAPLRPFLFALGWVSVGLGVTGIVVPGMPTTVFMIVAAWAFSKSSVRFHGWLFNHPRFGPALRDWHVERAISGRAKRAAVAVMLLSLGLTVYLADGWVVPVVVGVVMAAVALYLVTRPTPTRS